MYLCDLVPGKRGKVEYIEGNGGRLDELGLTGGCRVECLFSAPLGDPTAYLICGAAVAIRRKDARRVHIKPCQ